MGWAELGAVTLVAIVALALFVMRVTASVQRREEALAKKQTNRASGKKLRKVD